MVDGSATEHQVSDLINLGHLSACSHPLVSRTAGRDAPDHALLTHPMEFSDPLGMVDGGCPPASVLIELGPVGGLNGEGHLGSFGMKPL